MENRDFDTSINTGEDEEALMDELFPEVEDNTNEELQKILGDYFDDSVGTDVSDEISEQRNEALKVFYREPYGNEQPGRSSFITSDGMDTVNWLLPALLNVFLSQQKNVEFVPSNKDAIEEAEQMTDFINYLVMDENEAFAIFYTWFWDALVTKNGFVKYYFKEEEKTYTERYTGITEEQVAILLNDESIVVDSIEQNGSVERTIMPQIPIGDVSSQSPIMPPMGDTSMTLPMVPGQMEQQMPPQPTVIEVPLFDVVLKRTQKDKKINIENIAPGNVMVHKKATSVDDAKFMGIVYYKTKSDLLDDGFSESEIDALPVTTNTEYNSEAEVRNEVNDIYDSIDSVKYYEIIECYAQIPDEFGVDKLHRIILCDKNAKIILEDIEVDEIPIATITPFIKPYSFFGTSVIDMVKDLQLVNTTIWRTMLDYMYTSAFPQWEILDRALVNKDDIQKRIPGGLIRTRQLGAIQPIALPPFPAETAGMLDRLRDVKDSRTGVTAFNTGLDPNALRANTSTAGLEMAANGRQIQDMIARTFAETGLKRLYKGIYGLVVKNANEKKVIRLRGSFVEIDPTTWKLPVRVSVNVGLGTGTSATKLNDLQQLLALQVQFLPYRVTDEKKIYNTLSRYVTQMGYKDTDSFLTDPTQVPPPPQKPTPEEIELQRIQTELAREQIKADVDKYQTDVKADVELTKLNVETALKQQALSLKYAEGKDPTGGTDYFPGVRD